MGSVPFVARRAAETGGLLLVAVVILTGLALATWSVDDPSLNNATQGQVRNWLGKPGAMLADLAMQLVGLAAIPALAPPLLWGICLISTARRFGSWSGPSAFVLRRP